jgi:hypothetical protein
VFGFIIQGDGAFPVISKAMNFGGNLSIPNLNKNDQGTYECVATNVVTSVIVTTLLLIEGWFVEPLILYFWALCLGLSHITVIGFDSSIELAFFVRVNLSFDV